MIFGTFIETGTAILHAVNERIAEVYHEKSQDMPRVTRPLISLILLVVAVSLADAIGITALIGQGYLYSTYLFIAIIVLPLFTRGAWMIL